MATGHDPLVGEESELARTLAASVQPRITFGKRAGQKVRRIGSGFGFEGESPIVSGTRCASVHGFALHANPHIAAHRRDQLERLIRYAARGAVSLGRLEQDANGEVLYTFTRGCSDGTLRIPWSPVERLEKRAALIPPPRRRPRPAPLPPVSQRPLAEHRRPHRAAHHLAQSVSSPTRG